MECDGLNVIWAIATPHGRSFIPSVQLLGWWI